MSGSTVFENRDPAISRGWFQATYDCVIYSDCDVVDVEGVCYCRVLLNENAEGDGLSVRLAERRTPKVGAAAKCERRIRCLIQRCNLARTDDCRTILSYANGDRALRVSRRRTVAFHGHSDSGDGYGCW